jgi:hypothetical protein
MRSCMDFAQMVLNIFSFSIYYCFIGALTEYDTEDEVNGKQRSS